MGSDYVKACSVASKQLFSSDDLVVEILYRVEQKTLIRCKFVCKNWKRLISDQSFMKRFITRLKTLPPLVSGLYYGRKILDPLGAYTRWTDADVKFLEYPYDSNLNEKSVDTSLNFLQKKSSFIAVSSHQGFVLCAEKPEKSKKQIGYNDLHQYHYIICNPLTKQWVQLPQPHHGHHIKRVHLFCYDKDESNGWETEFKVVSFLPIRYGENDSNVDIYTSETGEWKLTSVPFPIQTCNVLFDGSVYFKTDRKVYAYDLKEEYMRCLGRIPHEAHGDDHDLLGLSAVSIYYAAGDGSEFRVWILYDGIGWALQHKMNYGSLHCQLPTDRFEISYLGPYKFFGFRLEPLAFHPINHNVIFVNLRAFGNYDHLMTILYHKDSGKVQTIDDLKLCNSTTVIPYSLPAWVPSLSTTLKSCLVRRKMPPWKVLSRKVGTLWCSVSSRKC
ncbi:hypothetical protein ACHQM5_021251 [Ranunculus cassubicifolius]